MADKLITDPDVIEQIRTALPVATGTKAGLADKTLLKSFQIRNAFLQVDDMFHIGPVTGFLEIRIPAWSHIPVLYYVHTEKAMGGFGMPPP